MSTLVLVLTAAMAVPGNGPEMVSAEMEEGLDLSGEWMGTDRWGQGYTRKIGIEVAIIDGSLRGRCGICRGLHAIIDEGEGRLLITGPRLDYLGIYEQDGDRLLICFSEPGIPRPTIFRPLDKQHLLTLHRVKPHK